MTLPNSLHNDIITSKKEKKFKNKYNTINLNQLKSFNDLEKRLLARERQSWMTLEASEGHLCCC